ncbi:MAG: class I SAM-dependent methyltransferase [Alphaproteobacteria bacterium]|nr:class I SAM-dependent methyltransferase [Alphaproteobacteria bacterium]
MPESQNAQIMDTATKPDPVRGVDASPEYAEGYARTHIIPQTFEYRLGYIWLLVIDSLLKDYVLLDVGCGTAGYHRLARNCKRIVGLDYSKTMIERGRVLLSELGLKSTEMICGTFEGYLPTEQFDAVNLVGSIGRYTPWPGNEAALEKVRIILRPGGMASFAFVRPRTVFQFLKAILFPRRTVVIRETRFKRMIQRAKLELVLSIDIPGSMNTYVFCRSN